MRRSVPSRGGLFPHRRNPEYCAFIRSHECLVCGEVAECAHVKSRGAAGDDYANTVPLCGRCHRTGAQSLHNLGRHSFEALHGIDLELAAALFTEAWHQRAGADDTLPF